MEKQAQRSDLWTRWEEKREKGRRALRQAEGWGGEKDGREVWEGRDMGIPTADSC